MTIGAIGSSSLFRLFPQANARDSITATLPAPQASSANSAAALSILPSTAAQPLSFETVLQLQRLDEEPTTIAPPTATEIFLEEARKTPMQRMREQVLEALGLTEDALAQMAPEERRAAEDKIREMIEEKLRQAAGADDEAPASNAEMLQVVA